MNRKQIIGLVVAAVLFILTGISSVFSNHIAEKSAMKMATQILTGGYTMNTPHKDYVAVVRIEGTIQEQTETGIFETAGGYQHDTTMEYVDHLISDPYNVGILLYVDSPGGAVYEADEMYRKLMEYKETTGRPIWDYMAHYAASGGYYISAAADKIYANPNTVTGSIGVIMSGYDLTGLYEKLGIEYFSITSGVNKDSSQLSEEQMDIYQEQVNEIYNEFVNVVVAGRGMDEETVRALADGRTYTAKQAVENGLIDDIASYETVKDIIADEAGTATFFELKSEGSVIASFLGEIKKAIPKSDTQVLAELAEEKHGGLLYYAEGLQ